VDQQIYIDRLLETENLTDNLEDEDAKALINWGIEQIDPLLNDIQNEDQAHEKINHLMQLMREINRLAGNPSTASTEKLSNLLSAYEQTFDKAHPMSDEERKAAVDKISSMQPGEAVKYLLEWIKSR
jgi:hypothetical protein